MRKIQKITVVLAVAGGLAVFGAAPASAGGGELSVSQGNECRSHDLNVAALNNIGVLNGLAGNALGGEGNPGAQAFDQGSSVACTNGVG